LGRERGIGQRRDEKGEEYEGEGRGEE